MGAVPKHKISSYRKGKRRQNKNLTPGSYSPCPQCQAPKISHQACSQCGYYKK